MKRLLKIFPTFFFALLLLTQCNDEDNVLSDVALIVSPGKDVPVKLYSGEKALYDVTLTTSHDYIDNYRITSFDPINGLVVLLDEACHKKEQKFQYVFSAPELERDSCKITLTFEATDNKGNKGEIKRYVTVENKALTMSEKTGIILFMPGKGLPDALSLSNVSDPFSLADSPSPESADIYIELPEDGDNIFWRSNTKTKFVRTNNFNYANASASAIKTVYKNSLHTDYIADVMINDIIIVGHGDEAQGVFYVVNVMRNNMSAPEFMQLNYKGIVNPEIPDQPEISEE